MSLEGSNYSEPRRPTEQETRGPEIGLSKIPLENPRYRWGEWAEAKTMLDKTSADDMGEFRGRISGGMLQPKLSAEAQGINPEHIACITVTVEREDGKTTNFSTVLYGQAIGEVLEGFRIGDEVLILGIKHIRKSPTIMRGKRSNIKDILVSDIFLIMPQKRLAQT